jgi:hypothetical protein
MLGGMVVPWVTAQCEHGSFALGRLNATRVTQAITRALCQICGDPLDRRVVAFARPRDIERGLVNEPGMHPECAAYSGVACPMLEGTMRHYRTLNQNQRYCRIDESCRLNNMPSLSEEDDKSRAGHMPEPFYAVWIRFTDYRWEPDPLLGSPAITLPAVPLNIRPIGAAKKYAEAAAAAIALLTCPIVEENEEEK